MLLGLFVAKILWLSVAETQDGQLHHTTPETHCFTRGGRPDINPATTHQSSGVSNQILAAIRSRFDANSRSERQMPWVGRDQALRDWTTAGGPSVQTVSGSEISCRWQSVSFVNSDHFSQTSRWKKL